MKECPILFSGPMVRAILSGTKTQTRRILKSQPDASHGGEPYWHIGGYRLRMGTSNPLVCPYRVGTRLWVRETFKHYGNEYHNGQAHSLIMYKDGSTSKIPVNKIITQNNWSKWRPSIHLPRWAARLYLEVTGVRVERVRDITEEDARAEGANITLNPDDGVRLGAIGTYKEGFRQIWTSIYGPSSWAENPWVWVYNIKRVEER